MRLLLPVQSSLDSEESFGAAYGDSEAAETKTSSEQPQHLLFLTSSPKSPIAPPSPVSLTHASWPTSQPLQVKPAPFTPKKVETLTSQAITDSTGDTAGLTTEVAKRCTPGEVRLAATWECTSPQQHDCASFCHPVGGELSTELACNCQCHEYVSAEELCDAQCLAQAPQLSLAWGPSRELILSVKNEAEDSIQMEVSSTLGPDQLFQGSARVHLVQFSPQGIFGLIISRADVLDSFLLGSPEASPQLQRRYQTSGPEQPGPQFHGINPRVPNPVVCLGAGDVILFQLHILAHSECRPLSSTRAL
ncbi:hypothetical protein AAY473_008344 [Plecturocebus cupreus]